jgi:hypothetical protein
MKHYDISTKFHVNQEGDLVCSSFELSTFTSEQALFIDIQILLKHFGTIPLVLMYYNVY